MKSLYGSGKVMLLFSGAGMMLAGFTILIVGMTQVFVPQDLQYMNITTCGIEEINANLTPLIAHDRAAFGGGLATIGMMYLFILLKSRASVHLWQIVAITMLIGYTSAIGIHFYIGYLDFIHLMPAYLGAILSLCGLILTYPRMMQSAEV